MSIIRFAVLSLLIFMPILSLADEYDATVTTSSGSYTVPVEIEDGAVTHVHWPNGGDMSVNGADIIGNEASGTNSRGENVDIEIPDYQESKSGEDE